MKFFEWLLANKDALLAIVAQLETIFGGSPAPAPATGRMSALDLREGVESVAAAQGIDLASIQAFIAAVQKWLPVIEAIFAQFEQK
ncbi:MAG TPA: hypothetical protein VGY55_01340 [Pirellulales bacterium]|jgi:hypothetical protein|nr:hypothetical protein [Pirellulales bacterium]